MNVELEKEIAKLQSIKDGIKEMGDSLWQGKFRKENKWTWFCYARRGFLEWYEESRGSIKRK